MLNRVIVYRKSKSEHPDHQLKVINRLAVNLLLFVLLITGIASCGKSYSPDDYGTGELIDGKTQVGMASWYGDKEHNRKTASGERFNKNAYTAAHRTLPFGTMTRVTNLRNGKDVVVKINDRGPFIRGRIIDLSYAAAKSIGLVRSGVTKVKVDVLSSESTRESSYFKPLYTVQVGSFSSEVNAVSVREDLNSLIDNEVRIEKVRIRGDTYYRVRAGMFGSKNDAEKLNHRLNSHGYRGKVMLE